MNMKRVLFVGLGLIILSFCIGHWKGYVSGQYETTLALAHFLGERDVRFSEYKAYLEAKYVSDSNENWQQAALSWRAAAEHYGGICKWLLENEPIYGTIVMDTNTTLRDCLIVSGSKEASVDVNGASGYIINNTFMGIDMDWVLSLMPVDANEYCDVYERTEDEK